MGAFGECGTARAAWGVVLKQDGIPHLATPDGELSEVRRHVSRQQVTDEVADGGSVSEQDFDRDRVPSGQLLGRGARDGLFDEFGTGADRGQQFDGRGAPRDVWIAAGTELRHPFLGAGGGFAQQPEDEVVGDGQVSKDPACWLPAGKRGLGERLVRNIFRELVQVREIETVQRQRDFEHVVSSVKDQRDEGR